MSIRNEEIRELIREMREKRMSYAEIGKLLKITRQRVHQIYTGYKSPSHKRGPSKEIPKDWIAPNIKRIKGNYKKGLKVYATDVVRNKKMGGRDYVREIVRARDNFTCQICLKKWSEGKRRFDVHHLEEKLEGKVGNKYKNNTDLNQMITLCHKCHLNLHSVREKMRRAYYRDKM